MIAIPVCCDKAVYQGDWDCPEHNPSKAELRAALREVGGALKPFTSYKLNDKIGLTQLCDIRKARETYFKYSTLLEKES